jgi:hypothetical protein
MQSAGTLPIEAVDTSSGTDSMRFDWLARMLQNYRPQAPKPATDKARSPFDRNVLGPPSVSAELTGSAEFKRELVHTFKFEAGDGLLKVMDSQKEAEAHISGRINPNGPGSTGKASHDALPGWRASLYDYDK